ncbi:MAG: ABC transporter permease [Nitrospirae bacterium]|nr:ABC transporter permease [Nitrospirota bacterium]
MLKTYILKKLLLLIPLLLGITFITFALIKALPGDPVTSLAGERANPETIERIRRQIGTDKNFISQFAGYVSLIAKGDLGRSYYTQRPVAQDIAEKFPNTLKLAIVAMLIAAPAGIVFGIISAAGSGRENFLGNFPSFVSIGGISIPVFWLGLILMYIFSFYLKWLPPSGTGDFRFLILPAVTLSLPAGASIARILKTAMLEISGQPFIKTARAKGLKENVIWFRHVLKNAMIPLVTIIGLDFGSYLNGAVLTETIFGWDGIGRFTMEGIIKRDYPVVMGCLLTGTTAFILINMFVDLLYRYIDPRVKYE